MLRSFAKVIRSIAPPNCPSVHVGLDNVGRGGILYGRRLYIRHKKESE